MEVRHIEATLLVWEWRRSSIQLGYDVIDNDHYASRADEARSNPALRAVYALPPHYFLASARFIAKKNLFALIHAYALYREKKPSNADAWHLVVLGDGELRPKLEGLIKERGLGDHVHLPGFRQYAELPIYYGLAGAFILASTSEQWGLVVNEAMACGLPVIVSERCGCVPDLVHDGRNGFVFNPHDVDALATLMATIASDANRRAIMGLAGREIISRWTVEAFGIGLREASKAALHVGASRAGALDRVLLWGLSHR